MAEENIEKMLLACWLITGIRHVGTPIAGYQSAAAVSTLSERAASRSLHQACAMLPAHITLSNAVFPLPYQSTEFMEASVMSAARNVSVTAECCAQ